MKPDKHFAAATGILIAAACLIVLTWVGTNQAIDAQRLDTARRAAATLTNQALTLTEQINRQILAIDQTLRFLAKVQEASPDGFDLEAWRRQAAALNGLSRDMVLTDELGIIRQSSVVEAVNQNAAGTDYFRALADPSDPGERLFIGAASIDGIMRQWHMNVARALHRPDGAFAGVIDADYRIAALTDAFSQLNLGPGSFVALVGLDDGKLRGAVSAATINPDASVAETPMFAAIQAADSSTWTGQSANDAIRRIHAFRHLPDRRLAVVVAMSEADALQPVVFWQREVQFLAACITALLAGLALLLVNGARLARRRGGLMRQDRAVLAAANAQREVAQALAASKSEQLEATLARMSDGVSLIDGHMCLVEWNPRFPEIAGIPADALRVGMPMEEILRAQIQTGQFGTIEDPDAEIDRRMARLRVAPFGVSQRPRPDGRVVELRRSPLPDGGFVTLYADVTERTLAEDALRQAQAAAAAANAEKSRFAAIVSQEIRTPLQALLDAIKVLDHGPLAPAQQSLVAAARRSGDVLARLLGEILDRAQMEAGTLSIQPSLFELRPLLDDCAESVAQEAAKRGVVVQVAVAPGTPVRLFTDPRRLRQVERALLSNAIQQARQGVIRLIAEPARDGQEAVRLMVRDDGPVLPPETGDRPLQVISDRAEGKQGGGSGELGAGLSVCQQLVALLGGRIGLDTWQSGDAGDVREGNTLWVSLPVTALPYRTGHAETAGKVLAPDGEVAAPMTGIPRQAPPRTRLLLTEDLAANQLVIAALLRREGHHVDVAASGEEAIQAMQATPYDVVFMDTPLSGMACQDATRIIRALPEPACSTPIIALGEPVSADQDALLRSAGVDALLPKPVTMAALLEALGTHVWRAPRHCAGSVGGPPALDEGNAPARPVLSVDRIGELQATLPPATFATLIEECLVDMDHQLPALRRALAAGAPGAIAAHAHALVGMAAGYGMVSLEHRLRSVMDAARGDDLGSLGTTVIADVEHDFKQAADGLRELLRTERA
jgi:signal transduction histidine kinase/CheY-like chemotaxis protein/HPt (histidine-containing phosphotransfer) domain-containing protein